MNKQNEYFLLACSSQNWKKPPTIFAAGRICRGAEFAGVAPMLGVALVLGVG